MSIERRLRAVLPFAVLLAACSRDAGTPGPVAQNVILVSIDTVRADHLGCYGYERETSPRIDAIAGRGTLFENALSSASWTVPAHMTMFTGLDARTHGLLAYPYPGSLPAEATTLAERLREEGFRTAAFTGGGFVSRQHGFEQGFDVFKDRIGRKFKFTVPKALEWLSTVSPDERFFLFLHGFDAHGPYRPLAGLDRFFCADYEGTFDTQDLNPAEPRIADEDLEYVIAQYDACIRAADKMIGTVFQALEDAGRLDDTLVVITSDHGEELYEHGTVEHTHSLYEELVRVPLILAGPGVPQARDVRQAGLVDLYPTILRLAGVESRAAVQGRDLLSDDRRSEPVFAFVDYSQYPYRLRSVRTDRWKLIQWSLSGMKGVERKPEDRHAGRFADREEDWVELFDLGADPGERVDVAERHPRVVQNLLSLLAEHERSSRAFRLTPAAEGPADAQYLRDLEALGYAK